MVDRDRAKCVAGFDVSHIVRCMAILYMVAHVTYRVRWCQKQHCSGFPKALNKMYCLAWESKLKSWGAPLQQIWS